MRRALVITLILAAVVSASIWGYGNLTAKEAGPPEGIVTETVDRGEITAAVSAIGSIQPEARRTMAFRSAGEIDEVLVSEGDAVTSGQILARFDTQDMEIAVSQAELSVKTSELQLQKAEKGVEPKDDEVASAKSAIESAEAALDDLLGRPTDEDKKLAELNLVQAQLSVKTSELQLQKAEIGVEPKEAEVESAQSAIDSAKAALDDLLSRPSDRDKELAEFNLAQARNNLWSAQAQRDSTAGSIGVRAAQVDAAEAAVAQAQIALQIAENQYRHSLEGPSEREVRAAQAQLAQAEAGLARLYTQPREEDLDLARLQVQQARIAMQIAETQYSLSLKGPSEREIRAAQAQVAQARAGMARLYTEPRQEDLDLARLQVKQATLSLESAQQQLNDAMITAPFDGRVTKVQIHVGDRASPGAPAIELIDLSGLHIKVLIDETDIRKIRMGQEVGLTLDAFPDDEITGVVSDVEATGTRSEGLMTYGVTVDLGQPDLPIKADMTATVNITVERRENVVLAPNRAIRRDKQGMYVEILDGIALKRVNITAGVTNDTYTEVLDGLQEGDQVVVQKPRQSIFQEVGG